jgi:phosphoglycolate phosphatase-like HAD superfamily hydrolase
MPALTKLRGAGLRLAFLSNFTPGMLNGCIKSAGLDGLFEHVLSTDAARTYKPDPRAYELGTAALDLPREQILFAAFAGWDAAGARSFRVPDLLGQSSGTSTGTAWGPAGYGRARPERFAGFRGLKIATSAESVAIGA